VCVCGSHLYTYANFPLKTAEQPYFNLTQCPLITGKKGNSCTSAARYEEGKCGSRQMKDGTSHNLLHHNRGLHSISAIPGTPTRSSFSPGQSAGTPAYSTPTKTTLVRHDRYVCQVCVCVGLARTTQSTTLVRHDRYVCQVCVCVGLARTIQSTTLVRHDRYVCQVCVWLARTTQSTTPVRHNRYVCQVCVCVGLARTIFIRFMHGIFGRETTKYTVIYSVYVYSYGQPDVCVCGCMYMCVGVFVCACICQCVQVRETVCLCA